MADSAPAARPSAPSGEAPRRPAPVSDAPADKAAGRRASTRRLELFGLLAVVVVVAAIGYGLYWLLIAQNHVSTDNAYVGADVGEITPEVADPVAKVFVDETDSVKQGQPLVQLDDTDQRVAVAQAQAQLDQAERKVAGYFANEQALAGQVAARQADIVRADAQIASAQSDLDRANTELGRRERLAASGAVSGDELTQAENQFHTARAALEVARASKVQALANRGAAVGTKAINTALISGAPAPQNPEVAAAQANLDQAETNLGRTVLRAPFDGVIAKKQVAVGQRVQVGAELMSVVPIEQAYVDANFKEVQLRKVRIGQPVVLTADIYGGGVKYHGRVIGLGGGTGAAFALIPAQNATGNWIKIVQRLPVRVALDPAELRAHPLRVGLSMNATIDVSRH
jgi:membrane fusion protein (multidrug efflux system)